MGIDARIFAVTPKGKHFTEAEVWKMSYAIGSIFGERKFMRYDGHHNLSIEEVIEEDSNETPTREFALRERVLAIAAEHREMLMRDVEF